MNSASLCSLAGRYDNPLPPWFLAPRDSLKIPAQATQLGGISSSELILGFLKRLKIWAQIDESRELRGRQGTNPKSLTGGISRLWRKVKVDSSIGMPIYCPWYSK
jgi:hypothetical protein